MSFWTKLRDAFALAPPHVRDYSEARLRRLWKDRDRLTDEAQLAVHDECARRGISMPGIVRDPPLDRKRIVDVCAQLGVLLQTRARRYVLVVLPRSEATASNFQDLEGTVDAVVLVNHVARGHIDAEHVITASGVAEDKVFATDARATRFARPLGADPMRFDRLMLSRLDPRIDAPLHGVLRATWRGEGISAAIAAPFPYELTEAHPASDLYIGSLPEPTGDIRCHALLAAATAAHTLAVIDQIDRRNHAKAPSPTVMLMEELIGAPPSAHRFTPGLGVVWIPKAPA
jgi:hypothetical protein